jgi:uncharacterized protein YndB with AHSA1/START domain
MTTIRVEETVDGPIEGVFDALADHANYERFSGIRRSELIRPGKEEPNGVGALRKIRVGPLVFEEEITAFERPAQLDYLIVKLNFPFRHEGGSIQLEPTEGGRTHALWTSSFEVPIPLVGGLLARVFAARLSRGFAEVLMESAERATSGAEPALSSRS